MVRGKNAENIGAVISVGEERGVSEGLGYVDEGRGHNRCM